MTRSEYSNERLLELYRMMLRIRVFEESLVEQILAGKIKTPCHLYTGEEAIAVGVCGALSQEDYAFGYHRSHGHYLAKGGDMNALAAEIYGKATGCSGGRGGSMHLIAREQGFLGSTPIVAGTVSLAVGAAFASRIRGEKRIAVSFFGDGAMGEGVIYEALNMAAVYKLPLLFVCENNFYSTHLPMREIRSRDNIWESAVPFGIPSFRLDGNSALEILEKTRETAERMRGGDGPVFLECRTYRLRGHVGPDDNIQGEHTDIRPPEEVEEWKKKDPIARFERLLGGEKRIQASVLKTIQDEVVREVQTAHQFAQESPYPKKEELAAHLFAE